MNVNGLGSGNLEKIYKLKNDTLRNNFNVLVIQEPKLLALHDEFWHIFPPQHFSVKFTPAKNNQGLITVVKRNRIFTTEISDLTFSNTPVHSIKIIFSDSSLKNLTLLTAYSSPNHPYHPKLLELFNTVKPTAILGDLNTYQDQNLVTIRDVQLSNWLETSDFVQSNEFCTWKNFSRSNGPDQALLNTEDEYFLGSSVEKGEIYGDHYGIHVKFTLANTFSNQPGIKTPKQRTIFRYENIDYENLNRDFENLDLSTADVESVYKIWCKHLESVATKVPATNKTAAIDRKLLELDNQTQLEEFFLNLAEENNGGILANGFKYIKFIETAKSATKESESPVLKTNILADELENWSQYKDKVTTSHQNPPELKKTYTRAIRWWKRRLRMKHKSFFTLSEYQRAVAGLKDTIGKDRVKLSMFPKSLLGKRNLLFIINRMIYSSRNLHRKLTEGVLTFIPKADNLQKLRLLTSVNRLAALCDRLVASRLDAFIQGNEQFASSRYGFLSGKNIDGLIANF